MPGSCEQFLNRGFFYDSAVKHYQRPVAVLCYDPQVVSDQQDGCSGSVPKPGQLGKHLRLGRDIKSRGGFVCDQDAWLAGHCHGYHHPLPHSARKLVRVALHDSPGIGEANTLEHVNRGFTGLTHVLAAMPAKYGR